MHFRGKRRVRLTLALAAAAGAVLLLFAVYWLSAGSVPPDAMAGKVIDENRKPVRGARVYAYLEGQSTVEVRTSWFGYFVLEGLPHDRPLTVGVSTPEYGHQRFPDRQTGQRYELQIAPHGYELHGKPAPALQIEKWYNAEPTSLDALRGQVVLLHVGIHIDSYDNYNRGVLRMAAQYGGRGLTVIAVYDGLRGSWRRDATDDEIVAYLGARGIAFPVGLDVAERGGNGRTYVAYGAHASPAKFLIDKKGILRCSPTDENLQDWIERLLAE
jgi:hypothetical protein